MKRILYILALISFVSHAQYVQLGNKLAGTGSIGATQQGIYSMISADGKTAIVGGSEDNSSIGAAWIYTFNGASFVQVGNKLVGTGYTGTPNQGWTVALSANGKTAVVGGLHDNSIGATWVFTFNGTSYIQAGNKLVGTGATYHGGQGTAIGISGDGNTIVVGGGYNDGGIGAFWIFTFNGSNFVQFGNKLTCSDYVGNAGIGRSINISQDGKTVIVGGLTDNSSIGATWIFTFNGSNFVQFGNKLIGSGAVGPGQQEGISLSSDGKIAVIGALYDDSGMGASWIYSFNGTNFVQIGNKLIATDNIGPARQGIASISADGKTVVVGGPTDNSIIGAAWIYTFNGTTFTRAGNKLVSSSYSGPNVYQGNCATISADGKTVLLSGPGDNSSVGAAWIFVNTTPSCALPTIVGISSPVSSCLNSSQTLSVTASGIALTYQWYHDDAILPGATLSGLNITISSVSGDNYTCNVINTCGVISSSFNLPNIIPLIGYRNDNLIVLNTSPGTAYQWIKNGSDEIGQTDPIHTNQLFNTEYQVRATPTGCLPITSGPISIFKSMQTKTVTVIQVITATSCNTISGNSRLEQSSDISIDMDANTGKLNINAPQKSITKIEISNDQGLVIEQLPQVAFVDFKDKNPGTYTVKALNAKGSILKIIRVKF